MLIVFKSSHFPAVLYHRLFIISGDKHWCIHDCVDRVLA